jgi:hypothetical protein
MSVLKQYNPATSQWEAVVLGKQGPSGTVAVSAPLTNSGTSTAAQLSVDYNVLQYGQNAVINGGFDVWQRGTSLSVTSNSYGVYMADRWTLTNGGSSNAFTVSRQVTGDTTNLPGIQYCARIQRNSGQTSPNGGMFGTSLETANSIPFAGKVTTLSFYARKGANYSNVTSTIQYSLSTGSGTDQNMTNGFSGQVDNYQTVAITTTWQRFTFTTTIGATVTQLGIMFIGNTNGTAGANDWFEIAGVQLEVGSQATPFKRAGGDIQGELAKCQRYYYQSNAANLGMIAPVAYAFNSTTAIGSTPFPTEMRITPHSIVFSGLSFTRFDDTAYAASSVTLQPTVMTRSTGHVVAAISGATAGNVGRLASTSSTSFLGFSAEL